MPSNFFYQSFSIRTYFERSCCFPKFALFYCLFQIPGSVSLPKWILAISCLEIFRLSHVIIFSPVNFSSGCIEFYLSNWFSALCKLIAFLLVCVCLMYIQERIKLHLSSLASVNYLSWSRNAILPAILHGFCYIKQQPYLSPRHWLMAFIYNSICLLASSNRVSQNSRDSERRMEFHTPKSYYDYYFLCTPNFIDSHILLWLVA